MGLFGKLFKKETPSNNENKKSETKPDVEEESSSVSEPAVKVQETVSEPEVQTEINSELQKKDSEQEDETKYVSEVQEKSSESEMLEEPESDDPDCDPDFGYKCTSCGLYPVEVLMISYSKKIPETKDHFANFWLTRYYLTKPEETVDKLVQEGFIELDSPFNILDKLKSDVLKSILKDKSLPTTGKKSELIERIKANCDENEIKPFVTVCYKPTEKGLKAVEENNYITMIHRHNTLTTINAVIVNKKLKGAPCSNYDDLEKILIQFENECESEFDRDSLKLNREIIKCKSLGIDKDESDEQTELIRNMSLERAHKYREAGFMRAQWIATVDEKCCPLCRSMHEKTIDLRAENIVVPPIHPGCRCCIVADCDSYQKNN